MTAAAKQRSAELAVGTHKNQHPQLCPQEFAMTAQGLDKHRAEPGRVLGGTCCSRVISTARPPKGGNPIECVFPF